MQMIKKIFCFMVILIIVPVTAFSETEKDTAEKILNEYTEFYGEIFEEGLKNTNLINSFEEIIPELSVKKLFYGLVKGRTELSVSQVLKFLVKYLLGEVYGCIKLMALVIALSVLCSYLTGLQDGFGKEGLNRIAFYVCYIVIAGISSSAFYDAAKCIFQVVDNISVFMKMIVPIVITTLLASGAIVSASVFEPVLIATVEIAVTVIQTVFIPLVMVTAAMNIVNNLSDKFSASRMVKFINQCIKWGLTAMLTVFVSVAGIQSIAASGADGLTVKLTKLAASNLIPVVGGILSESVETVMNCSILIKNSVGIMGIICLVLIVTAPLLKICGVLIVFRLTAAVAEPVSEPKIITCISELGNSISVLFSMLATSTVMFIIVLTVIINAGNTVIMLGR